MHLAGKAKNNIRKDFSLLLEDLLDAKLGGVTTLLLAAVSGTGG